MSRAVAGSLLYVKYVMFGRQDLILVVKLRFDPCHLCASTFEVSLVRFDNLEVTMPLEVSPLWLQQCTNNVQNKFHAST